MDRFAAAYIVVAALLLLAHVANTAVDVEDIASTLFIKYEVVSNVNGNDVNFNAAVTLVNKGQQALPKNDWELYFTGLYMVEPQHLYDNTSYEFPGKNILVHHVNGGLFKFTPTAQFEGLMPGETLVIDFLVQFWSVARTDAMPHWYIADAVSGLAAIVKSTETENLASFTGDFDTSSKWKRFADDRYDPWTPEQRWNRNNVEDLQGVRKSSIPTPRSYNADSEKPALLAPLTDWVVYTANEGLANEVSFFYEKLHWTNAITEPDSEYVKLVLNDPPSGGKEEGYVLNIDGDKMIITISADASAGVYYGIQTLIAILKSKNGLDPEIPSLTIEDSPRYGYRGMHVDVGRHFVPYDDILKLLKAMGMYKLNKLHFHVTDDEGWRVEMPWCPYLTEVGGKQCHDLNETQCLIPQFGSRPDGKGRGSGFYSVEEYKSILRTAAENHIEVIPEVDMPGHARAAIKATQAYLKAAKEGLFNVTEAESIQISDPEDKSKYASVQLYTDNALNPCIDTTYNFVEKVVQTFVEYHADIQPLKVMHLGGDEVAHNAWKLSPACQKFLNESTDVSSISDLSEYFVKRISQIVHGVDENLVLGLWEDGAITADELPFKISDLKTKEVLTNAWQNIWEWGAASRAYKLANAGYKVVMSQATHNYFDHPCEPDPEERGLYWATRYTDAKKTFGFMPDDLYANVDAKRNGAPYTRDQLCADTFCVPLEKPENIIGLQGHIWTETIRTSEQFFSNVFPRMIALAERAWHKAPWENNGGNNENDWRNFANTIGYRELGRLDEMEIPYRVPVAGAKIVDGMVQLNSEFPGLEIVYATKAEPYKKKKYVLPVPASEVKYIQVVSSNGARGGRIVSLPESNRAIAKRTSLAPLLTAIGLLSFYML